MEDVGWTEGKGDIKIRFLDCRLIWSDPGNVNYSLSVFPESCCERCWVVCSGYNWNPSQIVECLQASFPVIPGAMFMESPGN